MKQSIAGILLLIICLVLLPSIVQAGPPPLDGDPGAPIDGGASLLVGAAVIYGAKKLKERKGRLK